MAKSISKMTDPELSLWANQAGATLSATPAAFRITVEQADTLAGRATAFTLALVAWNDPATRTPIASADRRAAREALLDYARYLTGAINTDPLTTDSQRDALGISARRRPTPVPVPTAVPLIDIEVSGRRIVTVRLHADGNRRGKPARVKGASLFTHVGPTPPADVDGWRFEGITTRTKVDLDFSAAAGGEAATVWIAANWFNERGQTGNVCAPVSVNLPAATGARPSGSATAMKIAA